MQTIKILLSTFVLSCYLLSCNNDSNVTKSANQSTVVSSSVSDSKDVKSCFEKYDYNLAQILSKEDIHRYVDAAHHADIKVDERVSKNRYGKIAYKYKSNRTFTIQAGSVSQAIPDYNTFELTGLDFSKLDAASALEMFERSHKKLSDQEFEELNANLEKSYADKPHAELAQAKKLLAARKDLNYTEVLNLGTAAYWKDVNVQGNNFGVELVVLAGLVEFTVKVKISEDKQSNVDLAIAIARNILDKCS